MVNAQQWLDTVYPVRQRQGVKEILANAKQLQGELKMLGFDRLTELHLTHNKLTRLEVDSPCLLLINVENNPDLTELHCPEGIEVIKKDQHTIIYPISDSSEKQKAKIQALENQLTTNQQTHAQALQAQEQTISQLQTNLTDLEIQIRNHQQAQTQHDIAQTALNTSQNNLAQKTNELTQAQELTSKLQQDNRDLLNDIHNYKQTISNLAEQASQKQQRILALETDQQDLLQQLDQAKQKHQDRLTQEKSFLHREIQLIKEVLHD